MIKEKIAKLIDLKSIITLLITGTLIYGFVKRIIGAEQFLTLATMVYTFYFAKVKKESE